MKPDATGRPATPHPRVSMPRRRSRPGVEPLEGRALLSAAPAGLGPSASIVADQASPPAVGRLTPIPNRGAWTVMVYLTATDLAEFGPPNIQEMERVAARLPSSVKIVVLYDQFANQSVDGRPDPDFKGSTAFYATGDGTQAPWSTAGIGVIAADPHLGELDANDLPIEVNGVAAPPRIATRFDIGGELDTGDAATLANFVVDAATLAPADRYALILWDHGGGVAALNVDNYDALPDNSLTTSRVASALESARSRGVSLDLLAYDECLMATAEGSYLLAGLAPVVVASQEEIAGGGFNYNTALDVLARNPAGVDAPALASSMVASFQGRYSGKEANRDTLSAVTADGARGVAAALATFTASTRDARPSDWAAIADARAQAPVFESPKGNYRDLGRIMGRLAASGASPAIRAAAGAVASALGSAVFANTASRREAAGLSIYFPGPGKAPDAGYAAQAELFLADTGWGDFLARFRAARAGRPEAAASLADNHDGPASALPLGAQAGRGPAIPGLVLPAGGADWYRFSIGAAGRRGDAVRSVGAGAAALRVRIYAADGTGRPLASGRGSAGLRGLPAGEYLVAIDRPAGDGRATPYRLAIQAPQGRAGSAPSHTTREAAEDLGLVNSAGLFAGLRRPRASGPAWFRFDTPRSIRPVVGSVVVLSAGQPLGVTLYDESGRAVGSARGRGAIRVPYRASGSAGSYAIAVRGRPGPYAISFAAPSTSA